MDGKKVQKGERQKSWREGWAAGAQGIFSLWLVFFLHVPRCRLQTSKPKARPRDRGRPLWVRVHEERRAAAEGSSTWSENMISPFYSFYACSINHSNCISWDSYSPKKPRSQVWESWRIVLVHFVMSRIITYGWLYLQIPLSISSGCYQMTARMSLSWEEAQPWT